jgi:hypothetical protein
MTMSVATVTDAKPRRPHRRENWGEWGPCMRALPSDRWRAFVEHLVLGAGGHGAQAAAARKAGFGHARTRPITMAKIASRLARDDRVISAIAEESRKIIRIGAPAAARALLNLVNDPTHKDHGRAVGLLLARTDPETSTQNINVTHKLLDPDAEAIEELRALRQLGTPREKLLELFGPNGLERVEALELVRRSEQAKVIEAVAEAAHGAL